MEVIVILLLASLFVAITLLIAFVWSAKHGQFNDTYSPGHRVLFEDETIIKK